ncbi:unnamed protein product [Protopolystoma xenopodis]|uniref:Uncharacterized protein n=1 Tax=Protopolystoma xenopodis TaxID=117903 RepID=A0A3S5ADT2_9PLAT|nr:unnamed protein product [Protopolystoma xenopodis]
MHSCCTHIVGVYKDSPCVSIIVMKQRHVDSLSRRAVGTGVVDIKQTGQFIDLMSGQANGRGDLDINRNNLATCRP